MRNGRRESGAARHLDEAVFAINAGLASMVLVLGYGPRGIISWLYALNSSIRGSLQLKQTDLAMHGFVFFIFAIAVAVLAWLAAHLLLARKAIQLMSGAMAIDALPLIWCFSYRPWLRGWYLWETILFVEALFLLLCVILYATGRWSVPAWVAIATLLTHFFLWFREFGLFEIAQSVLLHGPLRVSDLLIPIGAPLTCLVAFGSSLIWVLYENRFAQPSNWGPGIGNLGKAGDRNV